MYLLLNYYCALKNSHKKFAMNVMYFGLYSETCLQGDLNIIFTRMCRCINRGTKDSWLHVAVPWDAMIKKFYPGIQKVVHPFRFKNFEHFFLRSGGGGGGTTI